MKRAIDVLEEARRSLVTRMRNAGVDKVGLEEKHELDCAIELLNGIGDVPLPKSFQVVALVAVDAGAFAEYRILWDYETEDRSNWNEIPLRLSPGDIVITSRAQFEESKARQKSQSEGANDADRTTG